MKKIAPYYLILASIVGCLSTVFIYNITAKTKSTNSLNQIPIDTETTDDCNYKLTRLSGYKYIQPLLYISKECESPKFNSLKTGLEYYINEQKNLDIQSGVSVYLCELTNESNWMGINTTEEYSPGSLLKVILLITHLKAAETNPSILDRKITFDKTKRITPPAQHYNSKTVLPGHTYTVRELLKYMVAYSDNYATWLLNDYVDKDLLEKTFTDFGIAKPNLLNFSLKINTKDYSLFMRVLYDAGYINIASSEYALSLLSECDFKDGIAKGIPDSVAIAHKFGESGTPNEHQLHESAIVFVNNNPYLLTIMTKGKNIEHQAEILSTISKMVYSFMATKQS